jgi:hypothetical protein
MKVPFIIYMWSVGIYCLLTVPAMFLPIMYMISIFYVLTFGWFAWALFSIIYLIVDRTIITSGIKMLLLFIAVPVSVAFAFQMIEVFDAEKNIWNSGPYLLFPLAATMSGWISLFAAVKKIQHSAVEQLQPVVDKTNFINKES